MTDKKTLREDPISYPQGSRERKEEVSRRLTIREELAASPAGSRERYILSLCGAWGSAYDDEVSLLERFGQEAVVSAFERVGPFQLHVRIEGTYRWDWSIADRSEHLQSLVFEPPPSVPRLYRGAVPGNENSMAWTDSLKAAAEYARKRGGLIYFGTFQPSDVLARLSASFGHSAIFHEWVMRPNGEAMLWHPLFEQASLISHTSRRDLSLKLS